MEGVETALGSQLQEALHAQHQAHLQLTEELRNQVASLQHQLHAQTVRVDALNHSGYRPSVQEPQLALPDRFNGNPSKLRDFTLSVRTIFDLQPSRFPSDRVKILFIGTLLDGPPLSWFRALREEAIEPPQLQSLDTFLAALDAAFGDPHFVSSAQRRLRLCTQGNRPASVFASEFRRIARDTGFNDQALRETFRLNLSSEVKDHLVFSEEPQTLEELIRLSIRIDNRLFERRAERRLELHRRLSQPVSSSRMLSVPTTSPPSVIPVPMEIGAVGKRGPLSDAERARRRRMNLCLYCGEPGHIAIACPVKSRVQAHSVSANALSLDPEVALSSQMEEGELLN